MNLENCFPIWQKLAPMERDILTRSAIKHKLPLGIIPSSVSSDCLGLVIVNSGRLRIFISSTEGKELTLFRLFPQDVCLFSTACMIKNIELNIGIESESPSEIWTVSCNTCKKLMTESLVLSNYLNEIMYLRIAKILQLLENVMWQRLDKRLAAFLLEESRIEKSRTLRITHEKIANHLGTAREVVTRILKAFQSERIVKLSRGYIMLTDVEQLRKLSE